MDKPSSFLQLQNCLSVITQPSPSLSLFLSLVMATVFSRVVFALQHTASSHCPAVTRAHISTGRPAVLYWKSHCYATYVMLPAALSVCLFISLHLFFTCAACLPWSCSGSHPNSFVRRRQKKACMFYWKTCSSSVKRQFYESSFGRTEQSILTLNGCWHKNLHRQWKPV